MYVGSMSIVVEACEDAPVEVDASFADVAVVEDEAEEGMIRAVSALLFLTWGIFGDAELLTCCRRVACGKRV